MQTAKTNATEQEVMHASAEEQDANETLALAPVPATTTSRARSSKPADNSKQLLKAANAKVKELEELVKRIEEEKELLLQKNEILFKDNLQFKREADENNHKFNHLKNSLMNSLQTTADLINLFK